MKQLLNILIVEDSQDDADLIVHNLREAGFDPKWKRIQTEPDFLIELKKSPDIILSDYSMPQFSGLRAAQLLQESGLNIPFILISGTVGEDVAVEAMKKGATDYLLKDRTARLGSAVERALREARGQAVRKRVESELRLSEASLAEAQRIAKLGNWQFDIATDSVRWSDELYRIFDVEKGAFASTYEAFVDRVVPEDRSRVLQVSNKARTDGISFETEYRIQTRAGEEKTIHEIGHAVRDAAGRIVGLFGVAQDVTESKRLQDELVLREQRLDAFFTGATAGLALLDRELRYLQINDTLADMNGVPSKEHLGRTVSDVLPKFAPQVELLMRKVLDTGESILNVETSGETPRHPGVERHWLESFFPILGTDGKLKCVGAIVVETTEQKKAEEQLRENELKFRQIAENISEVFWVTDPAKHQMLYISPAYEIIWARTCQSLYDSPQSWLDAIHSDDRARVLQAVLTKQELGTYDEEYRIVRPDGEVRWIHDRAFPVRNAAGERYRTVGVAEDITEQRKLQEQFRQAQKMEAIGQLAGGVAHDFNNILAVIQMQADLIRTGEGLSPHQAEFAEGIAAASQRGAALTRQLLLFSRKEIMQPRNLDLNQSINNLTNMLRRILGENIQVQFKFCLQSLIVHADPGMIDQLLMNLVVNSRDAMPGGGRLVIETSIVEFDELVAAQSVNARPGSFICLSVSDTGCGIPPENLQRIFEPFFTTKEVGKGTGLGLATVFGIVQQHQGWINVYSEVDHGTTFRVYLPRLAKASEPQSVPQPSTTAPCGHEIILFVEDDAFVRASIRAALTQLGYHVLEAANAAEALEIWKRRRGEVDLLLTDLIMPGELTGDELAARFLKDRPELKVIFASGYSAEIASKRFPLEEGVNFLTKPFQLHKLAQALRTLLDR